MSRALTVAPGESELYKMSHAFFGGYYKRAGIVKPGVLIIGRKHRIANGFVLTRGKVVVWDEFNGVRILSAPYFEMTRPGTQRLGYVIEEIEGFNLLETEQTTLAGVEAEMLYPESVLPAGLEEKLLQLQTHAK